MNSGLTSGFLALFSFPLLCVGEFTDSPPPELHPGSAPPPSASWILILMLILILILILIWIWIC